MKRSRAEQIEQAFQDAWEEFGDDKSTTFLISITADRMGCDYGDVVDALIAIHNKSVNLSYSGQNHEDFDLKHRKQ